MSTQNFDLVLQGYDAFSRGIPTVLGILDRKIQWHVPGRSPLSGDYKGHDEVIAFFSKTRELSAGTFSIKINDALANLMGSWWWCCAPPLRSGSASTGHHRRSMFGAWSTDKPWNFVNTRATNRPRTSSGPSSCDRRGDLQPCTARARQIEPRIRKSNSM